MMFDEVGTFAERGGSAGNMRVVLACADNLPSPVYSKEEGLGVRIPLPPPIISVRNQPLIFLS